MVRAARISFFLIAFFCFALSGAKSAFAQVEASSKKITPLILTTATTRAVPNPVSLFVLYDESRRLGFNSILNLIADGNLRRYGSENQIVSLGGRADPTWVVIPILNKSDNETWTFSFGDSQSGRLGFAQKAILYEAASRKTFFNTTEARYKGGDVYLPSKISVTLKKDALSYLIFYFEGQKGSLATFQPTLVSTGEATRNTDLFAPQARLFFLVAACMLFTGFFFKGDYSFLVLCAMWTVFFLYRSFVDQYFLMDTWAGTFIGPGYRLIVPVLLFAALWLVPGIRDRYPSSLFIGSGILFVVCGFMGMILPMVAPVVGISISFAPAIGISLIVLVLTWPFVFLQPGNNLTGIAMISAVFLFLSLWSALEAVHSISSLQILLSISPWLTASASVLSALVQISFAERNVIATVAARHVATSNDSIRQAREASEHSRLLKVLEQERSAMREMQKQETRQTEEMKRAKDSADEANMAKSAFLAVVSHEIRTPMTGIMGMVRLILDTGLSREQKEYAHTIQDSGEALLSLLNDILDFEKIESGKLELENTSFDFRRLLKGIHTLMSGHAASKNVDLVLDIDPTLPDFVVGDSTRLRQVLLNLVNNAIKFTARGEVTIHVKNLTEADSPAQQIYFGIQDSGIGISVEAQKKIFTPFAQADASINRKFGGTGLGLAICKRLIDAMGSSIGINSREGEGSTFFFTLQLEKSTGAAAIPIPESYEKNGKKLKVLVVDDNGINQKVLQGLLQRAGHTPVVASNADEAVSEVQKSDFDLVLMDIELPGKSGVEATRIIRGLPSSRALVPIVAMTGNTGADDVSRYLSSGMNGFLGKPVMPENLQQIIGRTARGDFVNREIAASKTQTLPPIVELPDLDNFFNDIDATDEDEEDDSFASAVRDFEKQETAKASADYLDDALIDSLVGSLGAEPTRTLLKDFYEKTEELIENLTHALKLSDFSAVKSRAHELKGMAANFGFKGLAQMAGEAERAAQGKSKDDLRPFIDVLPDIYAASVEQMHVRLS